MDAVLDRQLTPATQISPADTFTGGSSTISRSHCLTAHNTWTRTWTG